MYAEPYDPQRPVVCFDETSTQLLADTRPPLPAQPERPRRQDYEYHRAGARNLFLACEPLAGWRHVAVTERRTMQDFAHQMRWLVDEAYPQIPGDPGGSGQPEHPPDSFPVRNLPSGGGPADCQTAGVPPHAQARQLAESCPELAEGMAEIEFSVLSRCCLRQRLPDEEALRREVQALVTERNVARASINWRFNTQDARVKLHRLYPFDSKHDSLLAITPVDLTGAMGLKYS